MARASLLLLLLLSALSKTTWAQDEQTAGVALADGTVRVGEEIIGDVRFAPAPQDDGTLNLQFSGPNSFSITTSTPFKAGQEIVHFKSLPIAPDARPGQYRLVYVILAGSGNNFLPLPSIPVTFELEPKGTAIMPNVVSISISFSQKQVLRTAANRLQIEVNDTGQTLAGLRNDQLRPALVMALERADHELLQTRAIYSQGVSEDANTRIFFDDLHNVYSDTLQKIQVGSPTATKVNLIQGSYGQLQTRKPKSEPIPSSTPALPLIAEAVIGVVKRNIAAFRYLENNGNPTFSLKVFSRPLGATILYQRLNDVAETYSRSTDVIIQNFPLAKWTFTIQKDHCLSKSQQVDPFLEADVRIDLELRCSKK